MNDNMMNDNLTEPETPWERGLRLVRERKLKNQANTSLNTNDVIKTPPNVRHIPDKTLWKTEPVKEKPNVNIITPDYDKRRKTQPYPTRNRSKDRYPPRQRRELPEEFKHRLKDLSGSSRSSSRSSRRSSPYSDSSNRSRSSSRSSSDSYRSPRKYSNQRSNRPRMFRSRSPAKDQVARRDNGRSYGNRNSSGMRRQSPERRYNGKENVKVPNHNESRTLIRYESESPEKPINRNKSKYVSRPSRRSTRSRSPRRYSGSSSNDRKTYVRSDYRK